MKITRSTTRRAPEYAIVHANGRRSRVNSYEFRRHLQAGNLIQTAEQRRTDRNSAYVCTGLVAYFVGKDRQQDRTFKVDENYGGAQLFFEVASRLNVEQIQAQMLNQFSEALIMRFLL